MWKITIGVLLCALLAGCGLKVEHPAEELVTEVEMPVGERFTPGDEMTVLPRTVRPGASGER